MKYYYVSSTLNYYKYVAKILATNSIKNYHIFLDSLIFLQRKQWIKWWIHNFYVEF